MGIGRVTSCVVLPLRFRYTGASLKEVTVTRFRSIAALLPLLVCGLTGCTTLMQGRPLPDGFEVRELTKADAGTPFAVSSKGSFAAISKGAIQLIESGGTVRSIAQGQASVLCFSPSGEKLAAALPAEKQSILRLFDGQGKVLAETTIPGRVTSVAWRSDQHLVATSLTVRKYSFGSLLSNYLYLWDGATAPVSTALGDVTVRPALAKLPEETLFRSYLMALSPYGDEIAYSSIKDPPLFPPYQRIALRHLESGADRDLAVTSIGSGGPLYFPDGESLLIGNADRLTRRLAIPDAREMDAWPAPGSYPALSPSGSYAFLNGRLYHDGRALISFPPQSRGAFLPDGSGLAISYNGKLYLVSGLKDQPAAPMPADTGRLLKLRRLRSLGLISEKEYRTQKEAVER